MVFFPQLDSPEPPPIVPPTRDQVFTHVSLWETFLVQMSTAKDASGTIFSYSHREEHRKVVSKVATWWEGDPRLCVYAVVSLA